MSGGLGTACSRLPSLRAAPHEFTRYARAVDEGVRLTTVPGEAEAELLCGLLRSEGIECAHRPTPEADSAFEGLGADGTHEILVHETDVERARELITPAE